ncbi:MAG: DUF4062 domain-containing protein [Mobilitalea sp.]
MAKKLTVMVSSTVYGIEELLDRIYMILTSSGYEVWMSHKGTMPVFSNMSALENCLKAVESCDLFLGIITPSYGSSSAAEISFTHQEMKKAIEMKKPRWLLAHEQVVFTRQFLRDLGYKTKDERKELQPRINRKATSISDLRVIDMYEDAILHDMNLEERKGNWVQKFHNDEDALLFAVAQFLRYQEVEEFIKENFINPAKVLKTIIKEDGE